MEIQQKSVSKDSPTKYASMLNALYIIANSVSTTGKVRDDESTENQHIRIGYGLGIIASLALNKHSDLDILDKNSGNVEALCRIAEDEAGLIAFAQASMDIIKGFSKIDAKKTKKDSEIKLKGMCIDGEGKATKVDFADLPDKVKDAIRKELGL